MRYLTSMCSKSKFMYYLYRSVKILEFHLCESNVEHNVERHKGVRAVCTDGLLWFHCTHSGLLRLEVSRSLNSSRMGWSKCPPTNVWLLKTETLTTGEFMTGCRGSLQERRRSRVNVTEQSKAWKLLITPGESCSHLTPRRSAWYLGGRAAPRLR